MKKIAGSLLVSALVILVAFPPVTLGQQADQKVFKQEELEQMLAPIALYPDSLLTQVLMASTYPLEVIHADRWAKQNKALKGDQLTTALEKQDWDPSVKSMVNFPDILAMMSEKIEWTQKLGDAFLAQQKDVLATVQKLRKKAEDTGNLKTTKEQKIVVEEETIIIEPANPQVVYVPTYNPTVVYGSWPYTAYPPYPYYPTGNFAPVATPYAFGAGIAIGAAWGYAWGHANWHGGDVNINHNQNMNINNKIDRGRYAQQQPARGQGQGKWQHNPEHRKGVSYRDQATGQKFNRASTNEAIRSRENFRGRAEAGQKDIARGGADQFRGSRDAIQRGGFEGRAGTREESGRDFSRGDGAFSGMDRGGSATRDFSSRGSSSRQTMSSGTRGGGGGRGRR